ncbi:MAG: GNAT family N-acetyltransferase, partial [Chthoniobacteraceae bacterium]
YFGMLKLDERIAHERLTRICFNDYDREIALAVEHERPEGGREILAIGRLSRTLEAGQAEFAILVGDPWQRQGLGDELMERLIEVAKGEGLDRIAGSILAANTGMQKICRGAGFQLHRLSDGDYEADLRLPKALRAIERRAR